MVGARHNTIGASRREPRRRGGRVSGVRIISVDFSGLGVNIINLNRNISILGSNAVLYDMGFLISASGVVLNSLTLSSTVNNFAGNGGAVVLVNGIGVVLSNLDIVCNVGNVADIFAVVANDSNGLIFKNSKISFTVLANGNKISIPVKIDNSNDTIIENNTVKIGRAHV